MKQNLVLNHSFDWQNIMQVNAQTTKQAADMTSTQVNRTTSKDTDVLLCWLDQDPTQESKLTH